MLPVVKLTTRSSSQDFAAAIGKGHPFTTRGSLRGEASDYWGDFGGQMPYAWKLEIKGNGYHNSREFNNNARDLRYDVQYIVMSYTTPIALYVARGDGFWIVPDARYSVTTSRHQSKIRSALTHLGARVVSDLAELHDIVYNCNNQH